VEDYFLGRRCHPSQLSRFKRPHLRDPILVDWRNSSAAIQYRDREVQWLDAQKILFSVAIVTAGILVELLRFAICHFLAKQFFGGDGKFVALIRALFLGSVASWLIIVPVLGSLLVGIASTIVIMVVFEEIDHIERLQAFVLAVGVNIGFAVLIYFGVSALS
jgi:hypothetical protein